MDRNRTVNSVRKICQEGNGYEEKNCMLIGWSSLFLISVCFQSLAE